MDAINILWFRHGLRLHDNPALLEAINYHNEENSFKLLPIFIFDGESGGTKICGYNRMKFLLESLVDLDNQFKKYGGRLYMLRGSPSRIFKRLWEELPIKGIYLEQDCEPIWRKRDSAVESLCQELGIKYVEKVSHTLWDPYLVIKANGGIPPLTYQMFLHTVQTIGPPPRPVNIHCLDEVKFANMPECLTLDLNIVESDPKPEDFDIYYENTGSVALAKWYGGETQAIEMLKKRLLVEENAFRKGYYLPNQANPDIINMTTSLSPYLRFGCLSVRKFYWGVHDILKHVQKSHSYTFPCGPHITGQLIWREYFYTMSVRNPKYGQMEGNDICLNIPWGLPINDEYERWKCGNTGFPLIDAAMRQLLCEGWLHHVLRNTVASFLTRGGLWLSWELGLKHFLKYLLDADWSVCAGNWMWVSSSAFEKLLDSSKCTCPISLARRLDPKGEYICRYVPELRSLPKEYIHEPWTTPRNIQESVGCVIGIHYPNRIIDISKASYKNQLAMKALRESLIIEGSPDVVPAHCRPSNEEEIRQFFWLQNE